MMSNRGVQDEQTYHLTYGGDENRTSIVYYYYKKNRNVFARSTSNNATKDPINSPPSQKKNDMSNTDQRLPATHGCYQ